MKNTKLARNLWIFAGGCFVVTLIANLANLDGKTFFLPILNAVTSALCFVNAYIINKRIDQRK